ncbi:intron HNH endonuclease [Yasminevirus sp. GU-2018]|uniref:Intron HNH endonuclease n=1 Tax=Yasminevirus sp. GU-2018 TaxID=2420051 RepID=A0A5K0UA95_9VIRU|nr:intron HNH endonuclease [Yasminevirus sp. GU-2018]
MLINKKKMSVLWKPIDGFEHYCVSNTGLIKSSKTDKILLANNLRGGYKSVHLTNRNGQLVTAKALKIHRLVAKAFIPNDDPLKTVVNHIDANRLNNHVSNLEWVTTAENTKHGYVVGNNRVTKRMIQKLDADRNVIEEYESFKEAREKTGIDDAGIAKVCKGQRRNAGGFGWKFSHENPNEVHDEEIDLSDAVEVDGFPNYQIFNDGRIYSTRFKKYLKSQTNADGYKSISLANNNVKKTFLVHRLVAEHFIPKVKGKDLVNHIDSDKQNNHVDNLEWCDNSENVSHAYRQKKDKQKTKVNDVKTNDIKKVVKKDSDNKTEKKKVNLNINADLTDFIHIDDIDNLEVDIKIRVVKKTNTTKKTEVNSTNDSKTQNRQKTLNS